MVTVQDAFGNTVTGSTSSVTLALTTPGGATLTCSTNPQAAVAGRGDVRRLQRGQDRDLHVDRLSHLRDVGSEQRPSRSRSGPPAKLGFTTQPGGGASSTSWAAQPVVAVQDAGGNTVTGNTST